MNTRTTELAVGTLVLLAGAALLFLALRVSGLANGIGTGADTYRLSAHFQNVGGLKDRAKVTMSGVTIGQVSRIYLDTKRLDAVVEMEIDKKFNELSTDSAASILTAGLLGEKYIGITPGAESVYLKDGGEIEQTQSSLVLEDLIGKFLFNKATAPDAAAASAPASDAPAF